MIKIVIHKNQELGNWKTNTIDLKSGVPLKVGKVYYIGHNYTLSFGYLETVKPSEINPVYLCQFVSCKSLVQV